MLLELGCVTLGAVTFPTLFTQIAKRIDLKNDAKRFEISLRIVSTLQAVMAVTVGILTMKHTEDDMVFARYPLLNWYVLFWLPYFYYDAWAMYQTYIADPWNIKERPTLASRFRGFVMANPLMMVHHLVLPFIYGPAILVFRNGKGDYFVGCAFLMESTIPFIAARQILLELDMKENLVYVVNGILLMVSFGLARIYIWFYLVYCYGIYKQVTLVNAFLLLPTVCKCGSVIFICMNIRWFIQIVCMVVKYCLKRDLLNCVYR